MRYLILLFLLTCLVAPAFAHGPLDEALAQTSAEIEGATAPAPLLRRAELQRVRGEFARALADLERAERLAPSARVFLYRGRVLLDSGNSAAAERAFARYSSAKPEDPLGYAFRARALVRLERYRQAVGVYTEALARAPRVQFFFERAEAQVRAGDTVGALLGLDQARDRLGLSTPLELYAVDLELSEGRVDASLQRLARIEAAAQRKAPWRFRRGKILEGADRIEEARAAYESGFEELVQIAQNRRHSRSTQKLRSEFEAALARVEGSGLCER